MQVKLDSGAGFDVYRFNARYKVPLGIDSSRVDHEYKRRDFVPEEGNDYYSTQIPETGTLNGEAGVRDFETTFIEGLIYEGIMCINWPGNQITVDIPNERLSEKIELTVRIEDGRLPNHISGTSLVNAVH